LNNATFWPLLWLAVAQSASAAILVGVLVLARLLMAGSLQQRLAPGTGAWKYCWLAPVKDLMHFVLWALAFCGNRIEWRGQRYRLLKDGRLERVSV
jgi:ceramide glucosyltransferase